MFAQKSNINSLGAKSELLADISNYTSRVRRALDASFDKSWYKRHFFFYFREKWVSMLKIVRCEIISMTRNDTIDAYVLRFVVNDIDLHSLI